MTISRTTVTDITNGVISELFSTNDKLDLDLQIVNIISKKIKSRLLNALNESNGEFRSCLSPESEDDLYNCDF